MTITSIQQTSTSRSMKSNSMNLRPRHLLKLNWLTSDHHSPIDLSCWRPWRPNRPGFLTGKSTLQITTPIDIPSLFHKHLIPYISWSKQDSCSARGLRPNMRDYSNLRSNDIHLERFPLGLGYVQLPTKLSNRAGLSYGIWWDG
jgi:hypothetical protein